MTRALFLELKKVGKTTTYTLVADFVGPAKNFRKTLSEQQFYALKSQFTVHEVVKVLTPAQKSAVAKRKATRNLKAESYSRLGPIADAIRNTTRGIKRNT